MGLIKSSALWLFTILNRESILKNLVDISPGIFLSYLQKKQANDECILLWETSKLRNFLSAYSLSIQPSRVEVAVKEINNILTEDSKGENISYTEALDEIDKEIKSLGFVNVWGDKRGIMYNLLNLAIHPVLIKRVLHLFSIPPFSEIDALLLLKKECPYKVYSREEVLGFLIKSSYEKMQTIGFHQNLNLDNCRKWKDKITILDDDIYGFLNIRVKKAKIITNNDYGWSIIIDTTKGSIIGSEGHLLFGNTQIYAPDLFRWVKILADRFSDDLGILSLLLSGAIATWILQMGDTRVISKHQDKILLFLKSCALLSP